MAVEVAVALVTGGFAVLVELIRRLLKQNTRDHAVVIDSLHVLSSKVDGVQDDVKDLKGEHRWLRDRFLDHVNDSD